MTAVKSTNWVRFVLQSNKLDNVQICLKATYLDVLSNDPVHVATKHLCASTHQETWPIWELSNHLHQACNVKSLGSLTWASLICQPSCCERVWQSPSNSYQHYHYHPVFSPLQFNKMLSNVFCCMFLLVPRLIYFPVSFFERHKSAPTKRATNTNQL